MKIVRTSGMAGTALLLTVILAASEAPLQAHSHVQVGVSFGFGAYFGVPAYYGYGGYYYPVVYPAGPYPFPMARPFYAFVDTDIHPEEASVYLDGRLIGIADDYDGYPGYLAVKPGRHTLLFLSEGCRSLPLTLDLQSGEMIGLDRKLPRLAPGEKEEQPPLPPAEESAGKSIAPPTREQGGSAARQEKHGTLRLDITPPDARVVLDGDFFGTAAEISRLHAGIPLSVGTHRIRVSLSGYKSAAVETVINGSEERNLRISLKKL